MSAPLKMRTVLATVLCALGVFLLSTPCLAVSLERVMDGKAPGLQSDVKGTGSYFGDCIEVVLQNSSGQTRTVDVPVGLLLVPDDPQVQTMVSAGGESLEAPPGKSAHLIKAFCGERHDSGPHTGTVFTSGGMAPKDLRRIAEDLRRRNLHTHSGQQELWRIADGFDISQGNPGLTGGKKGTGAALVSLFMLLTWMLMNRSSPVPLGPASVPSGGAGPPGPGADARRDPDHPDRPSWSLMHRKSYDDVFDDKSESWVSRDSETGQQVLQRKHQQKLDEGYTYNEAADAYIEKGLDYDPYRDEFREDIEAPPEFRIDKETSDASKPYIGAGWLYRGDFGTSGEYDVVYKNLENRLDYLNKLETDAEEAHKNAAREEQKARDDKDKWREEKWRQRSKDTLKNVRTVQGEKKELLNRLQNRYERTEGHIEEQKKKWTAGKVAGELKDIFIPNPKQLEPLFRRALELRNRLQQSINRQDGLFRAVDGTIAEIKSATEKARAAKAAGDPKAAREYLQRAEAGKARLSQLNRQMQDIHKRNAQWQAGSHVLTGTAMMTTIQYIGQARTLYQIGKSAAGSLKPTLGVRRPSMIDEDGDIIGTDKTKVKPGKYQGDGSAASPEDLSRQKNYEFYAVDKQGRLREVKGTGAVDANPRKGELIVIRDKRTGGVSPHKYYGEGANQKSMHQGEKNLLLERAHEALANKPATAQGGSQAGAAGGTGKGGPGQISKLSKMPRAPKDDAGWGKKPDKMPSDLRELRDAVQKDEMAKLVKKSPGAGQEATYRAEPKGDALKKGQTPKYADRNIPWTQDEWKARDAVKGIKRHVGPGHGRGIQNQPELFGADRCQVARDLANRNPGFDQLDKAIRQAWKDSGMVIDDVVVFEPGRDFVDLMKARGISWNDFDRWQSALDSGKWDPNAFPNPATSAGSGPAAGGGTGIGQSGVGGGTAIGRPGAGGGTVIGRPPSVSDVPSQPPPGPSLREALTPPQPDNPVLVPTVEQIGRSFVRQAKDWMPDKPPSR